MTTRQERTAAVRFFLEHAGTSYHPDKETHAQGAYRGARRLAAAEEWARRNGLEVQWSDDWEIGSHLREYGEAYSDGEPQTCELATLVNDAGDVLASLGCVDDASDDYRRVIGAELALEARP